MFLPFEIETSTKSENSQIVVLLDLLACVFFICFWHQDTCTLRPERHHRIASQHLMTENSFFFFAASGPQNRTHAVKVSYSDILNSMVTSLI